jgi:hypothetical protein
MMSISEAVAFNSPFPILTTISSIMMDPTFASILESRMDLNANTSSVFSARGDSINGILALTISKEDYIALSIGGVASTAPTPPPESPTRANDATEAQIAEASRKHKAQGSEYTTY